MEDLRSYDLHTILDLTTDFEIKFEKKKEESEQKEEKEKKPFHKGETVG